MTTHLYRVFRELYCAFNSLILAWKFIKLIRTQAIYYVAIYNVHSYANKCSLRYDDDKLLRLKEQSGKDIKATNDDVNCMKRRENEYCEGLMSVEN